MMTPLLPVVVSQSLWASTALGVEAVGASRYPCCGYGRSFGLERG